MVSAGCAAAMSHATAACIAGGNPDLHVRIPNLAGFEKDEVIIPTHSRNVYDAAIRAVGVKIIEVDTPEALELAIGPRTAMIYIFAGPRNDSGPMSTEAICRIAKPHNVPVLVDAAAEILTIPNVHLQRGATLVAYSGGKYIRGPQSAGLLLGRKDLVKAAWVHSAPHHGYARSMKVGREEMVGHARRGRELGEARPRRRVEGMGRPVRDHQGPCLDDCRRDRRSCTAIPIRRKASAIAVRASRFAGTRRSWASPAARSPRSCYTGEPRITLNGSRAGTPAPGWVRRHRPFDRRLDDAGRR